MKLENRIDQETRELVRLQKLYDDVGEKYDKKIDKIREKEDKEMSFIWLEICKQKEVVNNLHSKKGEK
tara:strand:- start:253 stop:456 length:204 start_codon:yes stop_codon:yes gene_type:complete